jgi:23S rRNA pseudouridine2604 synthase
MNSEGTQINKYISSTGYCSRREADKLIEQFRVMINDDLATPTSKVYPGDQVIVDDEPLKKSKKPPVYIAFNKPIGVTTTTDLTDRTNIISYINYSKRIFPIGRLDKDSEGLILLTNDGDIVNKILRAGNEHEKEYIVYVNKAITPDFTKKMSNGIPIMGTITLKCKVKQEGGKRFRITLKQGLNRQIRKMCEYLGYEVVSLQRVRIMHIQLDKLAPGKWRYLSPAEIQQLEHLLKESSKN